MRKKKRTNPRESARTTVASIKREMQKPRLTESVRNDGKDEVAPVAEQPSQLALRQRAALITGSP
jgi:hypothetical protein